MDWMEWISSDEVFSKIKKLFFTVMIILIVVLAITLPMSIPHKVAEVEGEIHEIRESDISVLVKKVNFLEEGHLVDNPVNITAGVCFNEFNQYFRCNIGTRVRMTYWVNVFGEWWFQEAIIQDYSGNETGNVLPVWWDVK